MTAVSFVIPSCCFHRVSICVGNDRCLVEMGNNGSRTAQIAPRQPIEPEQWANSFPRSPPRPNYQQHKVLPERDVTQKLRATNNGEILHSGGTLSGRHVQQTLSLERNDKSFVSFLLVQFSSRG